MFMMHILLRGDHVGYRVNYAPISKMQQNNGKHSAALFFVCFLLLFCLVTYCFWPQGRTMLLDFLIPGDYTVTVSATNTLLSDLSNGESFQYAFTTFCMDILEGANLAAH